ncbi:hypothetical protein [Streptomyces roseochromogenus]|uniref:Uncharacterized protein n=1 Tax=Streptomyces roseochromogenus subsp. oscitans DS 12.976 TaxID=1352936 RepID=V6KUD5_STRRC|nr:hypothetical protein [Streptomyces roseochromogenus]EST35031.1 hypothetical protein M878_07325 [Streptomyces roseochromogenus subsp. oscitans DS 12.976]
MTSPHDSVPFEPNGESDSIDLLTAALRRDAADLEVYAQVLTGTLSEALPPGSVVVERKRSMADRFAGRDGRVDRVEVFLGEQRLVLDLAGGQPKGEVCKEIRGVVLSRRPVALDEWVRELAVAVAARAQSDARARVALERLVLGE